MLGNFAVPRLFVGAGLCAGSCGDAEPLATRMLEPKRYLD
jgi:hypothetical protein